MQFISKKQELAYKKAMKTKFKAAAFDIDGTLTHFGRFMVPGSLLHTLDNTSKKIPIAVCTGRPITYIIGQLGHMTKKKNWFVFCENGSAGYKYNHKKDEFDQIYELPWPDEIITKEAMEAFIKDKMGWKVNVHIHEHTMILIYHEWIYIFPKIARIVSHNAAKILRRLMQDMKMDKHFSVQDSGIGLIILPKKSGKGNAMNAWAKHLRIPVSKILVVGDQAAEGGNDEDFLSGENGTAFTVGKQTSSTFPLPVFDQKQHKLLGPEGTEFLLHELFEISYTRDDI